MAPTNACASCKRSKRKCDKSSPCSNCSRLGKLCVYTEEALQKPFETDRGLGPIKAQTENSGLLTLNPVDLCFIFNTSNRNTIRASTVELVIRVFGSWDNILRISTSFFIGTHQRLPAISRHRFNRNLQSLTSKPNAHFAALCICILLIEQRPASRAVDMQSALYFQATNLITLLETAEGPSLDLVHCRILVTFYETGHGLHAAAYVSAAASARSARAIGLHRKRWRAYGTQADQLDLEEEKRAWWAIVILDRFINLCHGEAMLTCEDCESIEPLPIDDLLWSESSTPAYLEEFLGNAPLLSSPSDVTVGQMARECQISHLVSRVAQNIFNPTKDDDFNAETAIQLERTLKAYVPLLSHEELKIGKYCGAYGMCNISLFLLYDFMSTQEAWSMPSGQQQLSQRIEEVSSAVLAFAEIAYRDREGNYSPEVLSPYLCYAICQAAVIQYRHWERTGLSIYQGRMNLFRQILALFTQRWTVAYHYIDIIEGLGGSWKSIKPGQRLPFYPPDIGSS
ncbi:hypothetical protein F4778DRAFT_429217 [Xylariomycetidae sp. FL2044]|nr:hypothetical protein F4778DRAFT_429217 [Xylariomycetidae sp. FL2044]